MDFMTTSMDMMANLISPLVPGIATSLSSISLNILGTDPMGLLLAMMAFLAPVMEMAGM